MKAVLMIELKDGLNLDKLGKAEIRVDRYDTWKTIKRIVKVVPLPKKYDETTIKDYDDCVSAWVAYDNAFRAGYNKAIDDILGKYEDSLEQ